MVDLQLRTQQIWEVPSSLDGSLALSSSGSEIFFYGPYHDNLGLYKWNVGDTEIAKVYEGKRHVRSIDGQTRGLADGRFLVIEKDGYSIISST